MATGITWFDVISGGYSAYQLYQLKTHKHDHVDHLYAGVVEDNNDPLKRGRVKARIFGVHSPDLGELPTEDLMWLPVMTPTTSPSISGIGSNPYLLNGSNVILIPVDEEKQQFIIIGTLPTYSPELGHDTTQGFCDPNEVWPRENDTNDLNKRCVDGVNPADVNRDHLLEFDPGPYFHPEYPNNRVLETDSGHTWELDDTPGAERVELRHNSGTGYEYQADGSRRHHVIMNNYEAVLGDHTIEVNGQVHIICKKNVQLSVAGNLDASITGQLTANVGSDAIVSIEGILDIDADHKINIKSGKNIFINSQENIYLRSDPGGKCLDAYGIPYDQTALENTNSIACEYDNVNMLTGKDLDDPRIKPHRNTNRWEAKTKSHIFVHAWDDLLLQSKNGNVEIHAATGEVNIRADKNINLETERQIHAKAVEDIIIQSEKDIDLEAGSIDNYCTNPQYTDRVTCVSKEGCYIEGLYVSAYATESKCVLENNAQWLTHAWIEDKTGKITAKADDIELEARQKQIATNGSVIGKQMPDPNTTYIKLDPVSVDIDGKRIDLNKDRTTE